MITTERSNLKCQVFSQVNAATIHSTVLEQMWDSYFKKDQTIGAEAIKNLIQVFGKPEDANIDVAEDICDRLIGDTAGSVFFSSSFFFLLFAMATEPPPPSPPSPPSPPPTDQPHSYLRCRRHHSGAC